jgi:N-methylhydantoinase A/oxoprolinase/acetone carboxylase beta subunit
MRRILGVKQGERMPEERIEGIRFGTTAATNALLERRGGGVALRITRGFRDLLEIGYPRASVSIPFTVPPRWSTLSSTSMTAE